VAKRKKSPAAIAGYAVVFVLLGVALYFRREMIKDFIGIKPDVSEAYKERDKQFSESKEDQTGEGEQTIEVGGVSGSIEDLAAQFGKGGSGDKQDGEKKDDGSAANIPMPGQNASKDGSPPNTGTDTGEAVNAGSGTAPQGSASSGTDTPGQEVGEEGLKGAYVEVIRPTEIYQGRRVLARAPKGTRFKVFEERMDEHGNRWLMVPFRRKGDEQAVSGWIRWDDVTLAPPPTPVPKKEEPETEDKEEGGEEQ